MRELNYESVKDVTCISVRKRDWAIQLLTDIWDNSGNLIEDSFNLSPICGDDRWRLVGSKNGVWAIVFLLEKILQSNFVKVEETEYSIIFYRIDSQGYQVYKETGP